MLMMMMMMMMMMMIMMMIMMMMVSMSRINDDKAPTSSGLRVKKTILKSFLSDLCCRAKIKIILR